MNNVRLGKIEKGIKEINQEIYDDVNLRDMFNVDEKIYLFGGVILFCWINVENDNFILMSSKAAIITNKIRDYLKTNGCSEPCMDKMMLLMGKTLKKAELMVMDNKMNLLEYVFIQCCTKIIPYIYESINCDISGTIYHSLNGWQRVMDDEKNDVVFTPWYVADFMAGLAKTNMNSVILDNTMGCGSLLASAAGRMIKDAEREIKNEDRLKKMIDNIRGNQIKGVEMLTTIYFLAVLNMSLMGVGLSNIQNGDGFEKTEKTQATVFLSNPPYSAESKGLIFTEKALKNMRDGYAVVLIQESAGSGQAEECAKRILKISTMRASIHMPPDIFIGKAGVQTSIYVFEAGRPHREDDIVKFIDFSNDGYERKGRKKGNENLVDVDNAQKRYEEIINIVTKDKPETCYYTKTNGLFVEDTISLNGKDWVFHLHSKKDKNLQEVDLYQTLSEYMIWKMKNKLCNNRLNDNVGEFKIIWKEFKLEELFEKVQAQKTSGKAGDFPKEPDNGHTIPLLTAGILNQGLSRYASKEQCGTILRNVISISANGENSGTAFYQDEEFSILQDAYVIKIKEIEIPSRQAGLFLTACINKSLKGKFNWSNKASWSNIKNNPIKIPVAEDGKPDWSYMHDYMVKLEKFQIEKIKTVCNSFAL